MTCPPKSEIGIGITRPLGFALLPRIKKINKVPLYRSAAGEPADPPESITQQYDQMIR